jgi:hypothetical protein
MFLIQRMPLRDIWDLINLGQLDPINKMIPIIVRIELNILFLDKR